MPFAADVRYWDKVDKMDGSVVYICKACPGRRERDSRNCERHESSADHKQHLARFLHEGSSTSRPQSQRSSSSANAAAANATEWALPSTSEGLVLDDALRGLLASATDFSQPAYPTGHPSLPPAIRDSPPPAREPSPVTGISWGLHGDTILEPSSLDKTFSQVAQSALDLMNGVDTDFSDEEPDERSEMGDDIDADGGETRDGPPPRKRARTSGTGANNATAREWFPWEDRITCTLDILMHLPRSVFSQKQLDLFLWILTVNGVPDVPSLKQMQKINKALHGLCGIGTQAYEGVLGHRFYMNNMGDILAQEMANPKVRPNLSFYPEDSGKQRSQARQSDRWLHELRPEDTTPMIRLNNDDFYIFEPTMLNDQSFVVPIRWFTRGSSEELFAKAWRLQERIVDGQSGWCVREDLGELEISSTKLLKNFVRLQTDHVLYGVPHPSKIIGIRRTAVDELVKWEHTECEKGNRWREKAAGCKVLSVPLWMYCNDTSGNVSKKWNEHNSFLFTMAGLPGDQTAREYNVQFLCTSNIAPPLEMLDGVVDQLLKGQNDGFWAWDCVEKQRVLIFPVILALLGDNPMQSEFACHIGLRGKYFCRACWVKGSDALDAANAPGSGPRADDSQPNTPPGAETADESDTPVPPSPTSEAEGRIGSDANPKSAKAKEKKKGKFKESMTAMTGKLREKEESVQKLKSFFTQAQVVGAKTKLSEQRTECGLKDTVQEHFLGQLFSSYKGKYGPAKQKALDAAVAELAAKETTSAVWRIKGLNPHQDTPVEILHVVLLGFVKYFWRDLIQNRLKGKDDMKALLSQRLSCLDVSELGISPIAGDTLVNYAGSLTGRDFRVIAQVAPHVIHGLVSDEIRDAWLSLSRLVPLIWQPAIADIDIYIRELEERINDFLLRTINWSVAWSNKPKFHIVLHLPAHIRRFGPAILFATEAFESFNAVIRAKSVHSNRQAPSRDIAHAFAQGNRVRHLLSGGFFVQKDVDVLSASATHPARPTYTSIGAGPQSLVIDPTSTVTSYLGLQNKRTIIPGQCKFEANSLKEYSQTFSYTKLPAVTQASNKIKTGVSVVLSNGDICKVGQHVLVRRGEELSTFVACVREILQVPQSENAASDKPDGILIQSADISSLSETLHMPRIKLLDEWSLVPLEAILCTVNTQHHCAKHGCTTSGFRYIYQERTQTQHTRPIVQHLNSPEDRIFNTSQMRDAIHIQRHVSSPPPLVFDRVVQQSCAAQITTRNEQDEQKKAADSGKRGGGKAKQRTTQLKKT